MTASKWTAKQEYIQYRVSGGDIHELQGAIHDIMTERDKWGTQKITWSIDEHDAILLSFPTTESGVGGWG